MKKVFSIMVLLLTVAPAVYALSYADTPYHRYRAAIEYISSAGIVQGYPDGTYKPDATINRAELIKIILGANNIDIDETSSDCFPDVRGEWYVPFVCTAKNRGIVRGYPEGNFKPGNPVNFVEALKIMEESYGAQIASTDVWYRGYVEEASSKNMIPLDIRSFDQPLTRGQMADMITRYLTFKDGTQSAYLTENFGSAGSTIITYESLSVSPDTDQTGTTFTFAVEADPHMDEQSDPTIYRKTLENIVSSNAAFVIDLGDIFMVDKLSDKSDANIRNRYTLMKGYYDLLGSIPLYFAMGNHDGEAGWDTLKTKSMRQEYFPSQTYEKNYYAFTHGNALFIVLDPYSYTTQKPRDGWQWTLGKEQYDWLQSTLESSTATHTFVFIHQLVGGDNQGRGGVEFVPYYEWGGKNLDGSEGFATHRPGWGKSIHQLLVDHHVDAVFKGHDHFYDRQELDGIVYQTVPQPSHPGDRVNTAAEYGYTSGDVVGGSGYLRVTVASNGSAVEFVKYDGTIAFTYSLSHDAAVPQAQPGTAVPSGAFSFGVQGDSHPERTGKMFSADLYAITMKNAHAANPAFYFLLGDDFSIEKLIETNTYTQQAVDAVYALQKKFTDLLSVPKYLVNGNHEQEAKYLLDGTGTNPAIVARNARQKYFTSPGADTGYYSFTYGDALFVVIDFYWHSDTPVDNTAGAKSGEKKQRDLWSVTLGDTQYQWFKNTLESSSAKYKFVFAHHVLGTGRGGVENAALYEWGGYNQKGVWEFDTKRPGWELPIHQLMAKNGVTIFFQGHDHLFAKQELDGVIYQSVPNPADDTYTAFNSDAYKSGEILPNSGFLNVTVGQSGVSVDYIKSYLPEDEVGQNKNGNVGFSYSVR